MPARATSAYDGHNSLMIGYECILRCCSKAWLTCYASPTFERPASLETARLGARLSVSCLSLVNPGKAAQKTIFLRSLDFRNPSTRLSWNWSWQELGSWDHDYNACQACMMAAQRSSHAQQVLYTAAQLALSCLACIWVQLRATWQDKGQGCNS